MKVIARFHLILITTQLTIALDMNEHLPYVVILAGGRGSRLAEETSERPKPMVNIGQMPILWHIMKYYSHYGFKRFIVCCGYKGDQIKEFFCNYKRLSSDVHVDLSSGNIDIIEPSAEDWSILLIDTGLNTQTAGRLKRVAKYLNDSPFFLFTYGDGLSDVNISKLVEFHKYHGRLATVTGVMPPGRFGSLKVEDKYVIRFDEKPAGDGALINGGFFVLSPRVIDIIHDDQDVFETNTLPALASSKQLCFFSHQGFWQPMDTIRDRIVLEEHWSSGSAPWALW